ncbi:MAG: thioredoxin domain-containing protein [Nitrospinota bacterium]|nr:thioredoxin domain-containing protein [Nitrospinota bacterium]
MKSKSTTQVTAEDILRFYKNTPGINEMGSFEKMEDEIRDYLVKVYEANHLERIYQKGLKNGWIENFLTPPNDFTVVIGLGSTMLWFEDEQPPSRKVFVLEYSDFQCPFCKRVQATMTILRNRFADKVQFGYRHFPLPIHKEAQELAEAVECARDQGRFWELQTLIYRNAPRNLDKPHILNFAKQVGVKNLTDFENCWKEGKHKKRVFTDLQDGNQVGVQATPTFIVGIHDPQSATISGEMFSGALSLNQFTRKIEKYISLTEVPPKG